MGPPSRPAAPRRAWRTARCAPSVPAGPRLLADSLHGCFNVVAVDPDQGLLAFGDFSGLFPLYWRNDGDLLVVSNRSTTVREVFGAKGWSLRPMAWLLGHNNLFGPDVPAEGISSLPPGRQLRAPWATGSASIERGPTWVWPGSADVAQPGNLAPERWDEVTEHMVEGFRDLGQVQQPLRLQLTGGKDTRVVLALALAALGADGVETYTRDSLNRPELACASHVAEVAGVRHEIEGAAERDSRGPSTPAQVPFDAETHWARVRQHAYRYESIVCPWDGAAQPLVGTTVSVGGFGGELYRRSHSKRFRTADGGSLEQMADLFVDFHQPHDPMGVLTEEQGRFQERWLREWVAEAATETRLDLLPERFYVENRLGHWNGPLGQNTPTRIVINPLLSNLATSVNLTLSAEERSAERFHYEVIRRTAPGLLDLPFYRDAWSPRLDPRYVVPPAPRPRELPGAGTARLVGQVLRRRVPRLADRSRRANLRRKQAERATAHLAVDLPRAGARPDRRPPGRGRSPQLDGRCLRSGEAADRGQEGLVADLDRNRIREDPGSGDRQAGHERRDHRRGAARPGGALPRRALSRGPSPLPTSGGSGGSAKLPMGNISAVTIKSVGIVGSGIMGSGIAEVAAKTGHEVILRSRRQETADAMLASLEKSLAKQVERGKLEASERDATLSRVRATSNLHELAECDLVIESIVEDMDAKKDLFRELNHICADDAILATNTSTLPVIDLAMETHKPERVCGVHFFNPAPMMSLVEIVRPITATDDTIAEVRAFAEACGKSPVEVKDRAGFIVNALLFPYLNNAVRMLENGTATRDDIDTAMKGGCNFPMGPLALLDLVGLDTSLAILDALYDEFRDPNYAAMPLLRRMVSAGQLGRKSGGGFYLVLALRSGKPPSGRFAIRVTSRELRSPGGGATGDPSGMPPATAPQLSAISLTLAVITPAEQLAVICDVCGARRARTRPRSRSSCRPRSSTPGWPTGATRVDPMHWNTAVPPCDDTDFDEEGVVVVVEAGASAEVVGEPERSLEVGDSPSPELDEPAEPAGSDVLAGGPCGESWPGPVSVVVVAPPCSGPAVRRGRRRHAHRASRAPPPRCRGSARPTPGRSPRPRPG